MNRFFLFAAFITLAATNPAAGQSTSSWVRVPDDPAAVSRSSGQLGSSYVSVTLRKVSVNNHSNWWTKLIEKNRSALATATVNGSLSGGKTLQDKRVSGPTQLRKDAANIDFGWSQPLLINLPVSFTSLQIDVGISKTAEDGVDNLVKAANDLTVKVPLLSASSATLGAVSAAKMIADVIFDKNLAVERLKSSSPLTATQEGLLAPGIYVCLAGDTAKDYETVLGGIGDLKWSEATQLLVYKGAPLTGLSYFVIDVAYRASLYPQDKLASAPLTSDKPWARLYRSAFSSLDNVTALSKIEEVRNSVATVKADAEQLLNEDPDFVQAERGAIQVALRDELNKHMTDRYATLKVNAAGNPVPLSMPVLLE